MGLSLGLERGEVSAEDLAKARAMLPRALEQYVIGESQVIVAILSSIN